MKNIINKVIPISQIGLPIDTGIIIPQNDPVRLLFKVTEGLNFSELYKSYSTIGRNSAIAPESLFRILVYGYMEGIYSSRKLEKACKRDINFKWLLQGQKAPNHNTIARFRSERLSKCIDDLFGQFVIKLKELGEINFENIFVDGTKIEANANRYTFVWKKATHKFEEKLQKIIKETIKNLSSEKIVTFNYIENDENISVDYAKSILVELNQLKVEQNIEFVNGKGKRKSSIQKFTEALEEFLVKQSKYDEYNNTFDGRNSFSKSDKDATFMHMKEDHMKNGQLKPAYNVQIGVAAEYIVGVDISSERSDQLTLIPFLEKTQSNLNEKFESVTADAGYESAENYTYLEGNNQKTYIKPQTYEKSKTKKFKDDISKRENMIYDEEKDFYICSTGKKLSTIGTTCKKSKANFKSIVTIYECEDCSICENKSKCTKSKGNKKLYVSKDFARQRAESLANICSEKGKLLRMNRSIQVEGAFGVIKHDYGFNRFLTRGKKNVKTEFTLISFAFNVRKLFNKTDQKRNGQLLHEKLCS